MKNFVIGQNFQFTNASKDLQKLLNI